MRALRIALAGMIGLAGALIGAPPAAFAAGANLTLDPVRGGAGFQITATYQYQAFGNNNFCPFGRAAVVFAWDGNTLGQTQLNQQNCGARVRFRPPRGLRAPGQHTVSVAIDGVPGSQADAVYTIGATMPSPTPNQNDQNNQQQNQDQTQGPADQQTTDPQAGDGQTAAPIMGDTSPGMDSAAPAVAGGPGTQGATTAAANVQPAWVGWAMVFGALLVLAGAGTFGMLIVRNRRERAAELAPARDYYYPDPY
ncbi:MAG TPA: hypothetical protein VJT31_00955 [Rugosimonospora sp.]|nr:hypothetical protein [Rugosimonospora sp.]